MFEPATQRHLRMLVERRNQAQTALNEFVRYLEDLHSCADESWQVAPDLGGFVRIDVDGNHA